MITRVCVCRDGSDGCRGPSVVFRLLPVEWWLSTRIHSRMATTQPRHESSSSSLHSDQVQHQTFSVSVGKDDWANQVIDNVVGNSDTDNSEATDNTDDKDEHQQGTSDPIQGKILEKKRLFHQNRFLELKNLPDCVTEQVNVIFLAKNHFIYCVLWLPVLAQPPKQLLWKLALTGLAVTVIHGCCNLNSQKLQVQVFNYSNL